LFFAFIYQFFACGMSLAMAATILAEGRLARPLEPEMAHIVAALEDALRHSGITSSPGAAIDAKGHHAALRPRRAGNKLCGAGHGELVCG
jgi:hypothetical protein